MIAREDIETVLNASGMLETLGQLDMADSSAALAGLEDLPLSLWIEAETYYPVQCELDMTPLLQLLMAQSYNGQLDGVQIRRAVGSTTVGKFNAFLQPLYRQRPGTSPAGCRCQKMNQMLKNAKINLHLWSLRAIV